MGRSCFLRLGGHGSRPLLRPRGRPRCARSHCAVVSRVERPMRPARAHRGGDAETLSVDDDDPRRRGVSALRLHRPLADREPRGDHAAEHDGLAQRRPRPARHERAQRLRGLLPLYRRPGRHSACHLHGRLRVGPLRDGGRSPVARRVHQRADQGQDLPQSRPARDDPTRHHRLDRRGPVARLSTRRQQAVARGGETLGRRARGEMQSRSRRRPVAALRQSRGCRKSIL